jgi:hypothetical protein
MEVILKVRTTARSKNALPVAKLQSSRTPSVAKPGLADAAMIKNRVNAVLRNAHIAAVSVMPKSLVRSDEDYIRWEYDLVPDQDITFEEFLSEWPIDGVVKAMASNILNAAPYLASISQLHGKPEVRRLAFALQELLYSDGDGGFSETKYEDARDDNDYFLYSEDDGWESELA